MSWTRFTASKKNGFAPRGHRWILRQTMSYSVQILEHKLRETEYHAMCCPAMNVDISVISSLRGFKMAMASRQGTKDLRCDV